MKQYFFLTKYDPDNRRGPDWWPVELWMLILMGIALIGVLFYWLYAMYHFAQPNGEEVTCVLRKMSGLYCPGCGATHALVAFMGGHFTESFRLNALVPFVFITFMIYVFVNGLHMITKGKTWGFRFHVWYIVFYAAVAGIHFFYVNYMLVVQGIALIP